MNDQTTQNESGRKAGRFLAGCLIFVVLACIGALAFVIWPNTVTLDNGSQVSRLGALYAAEAAPVEEPVADTAVQNEQIEVTRVVTEVVEVLPDNAPVALNYSDAEKLNFTSQVTGYSGWIVVGDEIFAYGFNAKGILDENGAQEMVTFTLPAQTMKDGEVTERWQLTLDTGTSVEFYVSGSEAIEVTGQAATIRYLRNYKGVDGLTEWDVDGDVVFVGESFTAEKYGFVLNDMRDPDARVSSRMPSEAEIQEIRDRMDANNS